MKNHSAIPFLSFLISCIVLISCNHNSQINRGEKYGGCFRVNASDVPDIIFPGQVLKSSEQLIIYQVYAGLLKYNARNVEIEASLAKNWRAERNQTLYTFYLHNNAYFHNDPCFGPEKTRKIVAADVKYSIEQITRNHVLSQHAISSQIQNIIGSEDFIEASFQNDSSHISGIEVINDTTIVFQLQEPDPLFLHFLVGTNSLVFPKEAFLAYGFKSTVGSGAFTFSYPEVKGQAMTLLSNPSFFGKNQQYQQLPFIDTLIVSFITSPPKELQLFERGDLDLIIGLSGEYVISFLDKHINEFQSNPPYYIMKQTTDSQNSLKYNFLRSNIKDLEFNPIGYFDLSQIYFKDPQEQKIEIY